MVFIKTILQQKHFILSWDPIKIDFSPVIGGLPGVSVFAMSENMGMLTLSSPGGLGTEESDSPMIPTPSPQIKFTNLSQRHCCCLGNLAMEENSGFTVVLV